MEAGGWLVKILIYKRYEGLARRRRPRSSSTGLKSKEASGFK